MAAWFAAAIAVIAAFIAMSNANSAKTQAGAALRQAAEATKAREAAEAQVEEARKSVKAAEEQVELARRAAEAAERSARADEGAIALAARQAHEAAGPKFTVTRGKGAMPASEIKVALTEGPALAEVTAYLRGRGADEVVGFALNPNESEPAKELGLGAMHKGDTQTLFVFGGPDDGAITLAIELRCVAEDETVEPWFATETVQLVHPVRFVRPAAARAPRNTNPARGLFRGPRDYD